MSTNKTTVNLEVINYEAIHARDDSELRKLFAACRPPPVGRGVFFLDLRGHSGHSVLTNLKSVDEATKKYFAQDKEAKMRDLDNGIEHGFKHPGADIETYEIPRDELTKGEHIFPAALEPYETQVSAMLSCCDTIAKDLLSAVLSLLDNKPKVNLIPKGESDSGLKLCLMSGTVSPGQVTAEAHTDMGLLTMVFSDLTSLELDMNTGKGVEDIKKEDGERQWALVEQIGNFVLVNVGNTLQAHTDGSLYSPLHRVVQPNLPPPAGTPITIYFLRPENTV